MGCYQNQNMQEHEINMCSTVGSWKWDRVTSWTSFGLLVPQFAKWQPAPLINQPGCFVCSFLWQLRAATSKALQKILTDDRVIKVRGHTANHSLTELLDTSGIKTLHVNLIFFLKKPGEPRCWCQLYGLADLLLLTMVHIHTHRKRDQSRSNSPAFLTVGHIPF